MTPKEELFRAMMELLPRLDERTHNIWRAVEEIKTHQAEQNGLIQTDHDATGKNTVWRKVIVWVIGLLVPIEIAWLVILSLGGG